MTAGVVLRPAVAADATRLSAVAQAAKAHWGYPAAWLEMWRPELTFDAALIARDWIRVAERDGEAVGVVALEGELPELEIAHLWVAPGAMGTGLGRMLFETAVGEARRRGARRLRIVADPHAEAFYEHLGAYRVGAVPSRPAGRTLSLMHLEP